jgi:hypothetical protein
MTAKNINTELINKHAPFILWIENYTNHSDNAGFKVNSIEDAAEFAKSEYHYGIKNACGILTENSNKYRYTLKTEYGAIMATKSDLKKLLKQPKNATV